MDDIRSMLASLRQRLWVKPAAACLLSILGVALAGALDGRWLMRDPPEISSESIEALLSIMASSMLVIAIFAAGAMVAAYASASNTASPRSFPLVLEDDVSQNAYSIFIGAFIFGVVGLVALQNGSFGTVGRFVLFVETALVFAAVILTFVRWVDRIARLGRMGNTIDRAEDAAAEALRERSREPRLGGAPARGLSGETATLESGQVGYVRDIDMKALDGCAQAHGLLIEVLALPGAFVAPGRPLMRVSGKADPCPVRDELLASFRIGKTRTFEHDPRFGLVVLSEIAGRALSPGVNDPGTAIEVIGRLVRLFTLWTRTGPGDATAPPRYPHVQVPELKPAELLEDAFTAIARDGAGTLEVMCRLMKALETLDGLGHQSLAAAARAQAREALAHADGQMRLPAHLARVRGLARFAERSDGEADA
jgi:uncharacterized membrane protein